MMNGLEVNKYNPKRGQMESSLSAIQATIVLPLVLRAYQMELAEPSLAGHNVIVCARTGSGKTLVAIKVIKEHLDKNPRTAKVAFVVPSVPLVNQQRDMCKKYLQDKYDVQPIAGAAAKGEVDPKDRYATVQRNSVLVMTPKILDLLLRESDGNVKLTDFSLLVLDECHHADKDHPYQKFMIEYVNMKRSEPYLATRLPQVLGLTASLGVDKSRDVESATNHLIKMAANLDAHFVKRVTKNIEEFNSYNFKAEDEIRCVDLHPGTSALHFFNIIQNCMQQIESQLLQPFLSEKRLQIGAEKFWKEIPEIPTDDRDQNKYLSWLCYLIKQVKSLRDSNTKMEVMSWLRHLEAYQSGLELNEHLPTRCVGKCLMKEMKPLTDGRSQTNSKVCVQIYEKNLAQLNTCLSNSQYEGNGLYDELCDILRKEYVKSNSGLTIIIARTRNIVISLAQFINQSNLGCNAAFVTSINTAGQQGGMTARQQEDVLTDFRNSKIKVLVGTKVIAEGLDIPLCSLVIKYNDVGNERDLIQIRGRGREKHSRSILIARKEYILLKEEKNIERESLMEKTLKCIEKMHNFPDRVELKQKKDYEERTRKEEYFASAPCKNAHYRMVCADCDQFFSTSNQIRRIDSLMVCIDFQVWSKLIYLDCKLDGVPKESVDRIVLRTKLGCPRCKRHVGHIAKTGETYYPVFTADRFVLMTPSGKLEESRKQWSQIEDRYFKPPDISESEKNNIKVQFIQNEPTILKKIKGMIDQARRDKTTRVNPFRSPNSSLKILPFKW